MNLLRYIKTVLWSFIGIGRRQDMAQLSERGNPLILVVFCLCTFAGVFDHPSAGSTLGSWSLIFCSACNSNSAT